ncbi:metallophosphoesterase 1 homolog isoform X1 [Achroia grisella]|uniref:metallophosphoesterase 1 homolog isoform X1 n=1 Tax=Achroia grisella TaxID=688607 RepID=UPI0027D2C72D|nr:metallophosphoesterase 1 homolog isoform X1 [Achroia grisella]
MYFRRSTTVKYFIAALLAAALYCEWLIYLVQPLYWQNLECPSHDPSCTKILFIADPQIQGDEAVPPPLSYLFNWDSDRYLKTTFSVVMNHFKPDVLVYLGDLMDEGSISTLPQFHSYVKRLSNIFDVNYPIVQVWIPGDNDIGGENEPIKKDKIEDFKRVFQQPTVVTFRNISFYKVNAITYTYPKKPEIEDNNLRIGVSHYPVTNKHAFVQKVNNEIHPNIYFCAHDHESKYVQQKKDLTQRSSHQMLAGNFVLRVPFYEDSLYEIFVPTCSYRMGTGKIGYGVAIIESNNQEMKYTVLWSPKRFPYLFFYAGIVIVLVLYSFIFFSARLAHKRLKSVIKSDKVPLLERI